MKGQQDIEIEICLVVFVTPKNPHFDPSLTSEWQFNQKLQLERFWD